MYVMPKMAPAAFPSTSRRSRLVPAMSTTEYIRVISHSPTTGPVFPDAIVLTISLGRPIGAAVLITAEIRLVPPLPPVPMMPWISAVCNNSVTHLVTQLMRNSIAWPRGRLNRLVLSPGAYLVSRSVWLMVMASSVMA